MKRITLTSGCLLWMAAAAIGAQPGGSTYYVAVELNLDGAVRDAGATAGNSPVGSRITAEGETHATVRRVEGEIDLHPAGAASSVALAGNPEEQVGSASFGSHTHAMAWRSSAGSAVDLHEVLPAGYADSTATGIDDAGNVTGVAIDFAGVAHDILWRAVRSTVTALSSGGGGGGAAGGGGGGGVTATDKISITRALWFGNAMAAPTGELLVQATSSSSSAVLTLTETSTGRVIATLPNIGGGKYGGSVIFQFNPVTSVTVTSSLGGTATRSVILGVQ